MAAVTICSDFGAPKNKVSNYFHCFPIYLPWSNGTRCHDLSFFECWVLNQLFLSPLSLLSRSSLVILFAFCHKRVSSAYLLLLLNRFSHVRLCATPPGSPISEILQARTLEWVAISFSNAWKWKMKVKSLSHVWLLATPWTAAYQAPPSREFSRQEYWSGLPLPSLRLLIFLPAILILACVSSSPALHIMYSV